jgi:transposase
MVTFLDIIECLPDFSLWALDETGKRLESSNFYSWSKIGESPVIEHNADHTGANIIGATEIMNHYKFLYTAYPVDWRYEKEDYTINHERVIEFLLKIIEYDKQRGIKKSVIIMDNARFHKAKQVREFAVEHKEDLAIIFQPKYSPQLNPQEQIWNWMKKVLSKCLSYKSVNDLLNKVISFQDYLSNNPEEVKHQIYARNYYK